MANTGLSPLDPTSDVGKVRLVIGDTEATAGSYVYFSDDAITVALSIAGGGITRACGVLVKQLALSLTIAGQSIGADGFTINTLGKGRDLLQVALSYEKQADEEDLRGARESEGAYQVVNTRLNQRPADSRFLPGLGGPWVLQMPGDALTFNVPF